MVAEESVAWGMQLSLEFGHGCDQCTSLKPRAGARCQPVLAHVGRLLGAFMHCCADHPFLAVLDSPAKGE